MTKEKAVEVLLHYLLTGETGEKADFKVAIRICLDFAEYPRKPWSRRKEGYGCQITP